MTLTCLGLRALLFLLWCTAATARAGMSLSQPNVDQGLSGENMGRLQDYSRQVGENWLKNSLGLDLQKLQMIWDPNNFSFESAGAATVPAPAAAGAGAGLPGPSAPELGRRISLRLEQTDDLTHLVSGMRDVPFGLEVKGFVPLLASLSALETRLTVPLSPRDEWRAQTTLPFTLMGATRSLWWKSMGLGDSLAFRSDLRSRLGLNQVEAGFGTAWITNSLGAWNLDYDYHLRFGQGGEEATHWLKVSREF